MKALRLYSETKQLILEELDVPVLENDDDILIDVKYSGICGTDLHAIKGNYPTAKGGVTMGHEFSGIVVKVGSAVHTIKCGDHVTVDPYRGCSKCSHCARGNPHFCKFEGASNALGFFRNGGWAQKCLVPAQQAHVIDPSMHLEDNLACLVETLSTIQHGLDRIGLIPFDSRILIIGAGIIGILYACIFHRQGLRNVYISEPVKHRRDLLEQLDLGFKAMDPSETSKMMDESMEDLDKFGFDYIVDCSGYTPAVEQAFGWLRCGGKLCIFGVAPPSAGITISPNKMFHKELTIIGTFTNPFCYPKAIGLTQALGLRYLSFDRLGIECFDIKDYQKALDKLAAGSISKAVFKFM